MKIKAILFDCDGLMFNTEVIAQNLWRETASKHHIEMPEEFLKAITGSNVESVIQNYPEMRIIQEEAGNKRFDISYWSTFQEDELNKEGLIPLLQYLHKNHYLIGICSSSPKQYVETLLHKVSIPIGYQKLLCGDMITKAKPDPEIFLKCAESLGVKPEECLVLEDSKNGLFAAKNAGMHHCFIKDTIEKDRDIETILEYECSNLEEVILLLERAI